MLFIVVLTKVDQDISNFFSICSIDIFNEKYVLNIAKLKTIWSRGKEKLGELNNEIKLYPRID